MRTPLPEKMGRRLPYGLLFLAVLAVDQLSKALIRQLPLGGSMTALPGLLQLTHVENTGASFSILAGNNQLLIWIALLVLGLLLYWHDAFTAPPERAGYALILAGLVGNLLDRLFLGAVTDLFDLGWWPVFNVADSALVVGVLTLVGYELYRKREGRREERGGS